MELNNVEVFPVSDVIYIGVGEGTDQLRAMHDALNIGGVHFDEPFRYQPHVTLAQNLKPDELDELLHVAQHRWLDYPHTRRFQVETLTFVQSTQRKDWIDLSECKLDLGEPAFSRIDRSSHR